MNYWKVINKTYRPEPNQNIVFKKGENLWIKYEIFFISGWEVLRSEVQSEYRYFKDWILDFVRNFIKQDINFFEGHPKFVVISHLVLYSIFRMNLNNFFT